MKETFFPPSRGGCLILLGALLCFCGVANADDQLEIAGSSTVYPFTTVVAERFGLVTGSSTPKVEATGTGGGMKLLCAGIGDEYPDLTNASRSIKPSEIELCAKNGIGVPLEIKIGFDGIVVAQSQASKQLDLTREQLFLALARDLPNADGDPVPNPNIKWSDIDSSLPALEIRVYGPPPTSGTRDAFVELVMEVGCKNAPNMDVLESKDAEMHEAVCKAMREDGAFIEAGENDNLIIQRLVSNPDTLGIFGYSFLEENLDKVTGIKIEGVEPEFESIEAGEYTLARPLFVYAKTEHAKIKPSLMEFVNFYVSEDAIGPDGYLIDRGLVPLPDEEAEKVRMAVKAAGI